MTKGKKWTLRLLGVAALALLICLCLLGSTMARYTSSGEGKGTLTVALWDLEVTGSSSGDDTLEFDTDAISPSADKYSAEAARTNTSGWVKAFAIQNNSDVAALVDVSLKTESTDENATVDLKWDDYFTWGTGWDSEKYSGDTENATKYEGRSQTNDYAKDLMAKFGTGFTADDFITLVNAWGVISLELSTDSTTAAGSGSSSLTGIELDAASGTSGSNAKDIYAEVVWTSVYYNGDFTYGNAKLPESMSFSGWEEFSDAVDTILGMYVTTIEFDVEWTAVQNSTLPPTTP